MSLDGFIAGPTGDIGWTAPEEEQFRFHIEQTRHVAAHLCGRGLYQEMLVRETAEQTMFSEAELEFARIRRRSRRWCSGMTTVVHSGADGRGGDGGERHDDGEIRV